MSTRQKRTLGELSAAELLKSAGTECGGLNAVLERSRDQLDRETYSLMAAYLGSIWSRLTVARGKLEPEEVAA